MFLLLLLSVFSMCSLAQLLIIYLVVISYQKLINIFVKLTKQIMILQKGIHLTVECVFSMWSWAELLVSHLVVIDFTLQTQRQSFLLCFHHYCVDRGTSLFDVSQCHICFCFFLFVFDDPVTSNCHKKIFVYMISAVQNY